MGKGRYWDGCTVEGVQYDDSCGEEVCGVYGLARECAREGDFEGVERGVDGACDVMPYR